MNEPELQIKFLENGVGLPVPHYQTVDSSGMDLYAAVKDEVTLNRGDIKCIPTGIAIAIQPGYEAQVRPRSGLALKFGISIVNTPGTIDADYRGEVGIIVINHGNTPFVVTRGMRIAQLVIQPVCKVSVTVKDELSETERGEGGFGHTGH